MFLLSGLMGLAVMFVAPTAPAFLWSLLTAALALFIAARQRTATLAARCETR
jgi:hypothetical protein